MRSRVDVDADCVHHDSSAWREPASAQAKRHRTRSSASPRLLCTIQRVAASLTSVAPGVMVTTGSMGVRVDA